MKKLRLFFMMALAVLFTGMAFAQATNQNPVVKAISVEDKGVGGEALSTGIYKNASALWTKTLSGNVTTTYWETPKTLRYTYQALDDAGTTVIPSPIVDEEGEQTGTAESIVKYETLMAFAGVIPTQQQLVMDKLFPNNLYRVMVEVFEPDEDNEEVPARGATIYTSEWKYFISAPAQLQPGKLLWNAAFPVEYLDEDAQADVTGVLSWKFDEFDQSLSKHTEIPNVVGHVKLTENDVQVVNSESTAEPPMTFTYEMGIVVGEKHYVLTAWATYEYDKKELRYNADGTGYAYKDGTKGTVEQAVPEKEYTFGGSTILPVNIHVGVLETAGKKYTTVNVVGLPTGINKTQGQIDVTFDNGKTWKTYGANMSPDSKLAQFPILNNDEKEFKFKIRFWTLGENNEFVYFTTPDYDSATPQLGTVHMGGVLTDLDLTDKYLLWGANHPAYVLPLTALPGVEETTGLNINFEMFYKRHIEGQTEEEDLAATGRRIPGVVSEDKSTVTFTIPIPAGGNSGAQMESWYRFMQITAVDENEAYLNQLKKTWNFYTSEACVVESDPADLFQVNSTYSCGNLIFDGEITARNPKTGERLMDPDTPAEYAKLHYYDWAWTPGAAPIIDAIGIEHKDTVTFITVKDGADKKEFYTSKIAYAAPTKYNNGQTIEQLFVYEGAPMTKTEGAYDFTTAYYKRTIANPTADVATYDNYTEAWWGEQYVTDYLANLTEGQKPTGEYGPYTFALVAKGEVEEGWTVETECGFTMASRRGKINLGSEGTPWDLNEYNAVPVYKAVPTDQLNVPTVEPQYIIYNIFNNIYDADKAWTGPCDFTIHATLTEVLEEGATPNPDDPWTTDDVTGHVTELGEVVLDNKQAFVKVPAGKPYTVEGYMLYTPTRYTKLDVTDNNYTPGTPEEGPVVKVTFKLTFTVDEEFDINQNVEPTVKYWIVEEDADGNGQVQARIYDMAKNPNQIYVQLISNPLYPAGVKPVSEGWVPAVKETVDGVETVKERGYYSFVFTVDNVVATDKILRQYNFGYTCAFTDGTNYGPATHVSKNSTTWAPIFTPDPYITFEKHAPLSVSSEDGYVAEKTVGPWKGELTAFSNELKNFFAFTDQELPTGFENWPDFWGNPEVAWNLVYNLQPQVSATAMRGVTKKVEKNYAPTVRLDDSTHEVEFGYADDPAYVPVKKTVRYEFFNDVQFKAADAKYTATFNAANLKRTVMVPFNATTEATVQKFQSITLDEAAKQVNFVFAAKLDTNGDPDNALTHTYPYIVKAAAKGDVEFVGTDVTIYKSTEKPNTFGVKLEENGTVVMEAEMWGYFKPTWNQDIVVANEDYDFYRYSNGILQIPEKGADGNAVAWGGAPQAWQPNWKGVNAFECAFSFWKNKNYQSEYAISIRDAEDGDATMIQSINVVTESNELFDLMGRKVVEPVKGQIYIQNGKKILF